MSKSTAKQSEELVADAFEDAGYDSWIPPDGHFNEQNDIFNLFDVAAFGHDSLWFVQVKTNQVRSISEWFANATVFEEHLTDVVVAYAVVHDDDGSEGVRLARSDPDGYEWVCDGRESSAVPGEAITEYLGAVP